MSLETATLNSVENTTSLEQEFFERIRERKENLEKIDNEPPIKLAEGASKIKSEGKDGLEIKIMSDEKLRDIVLGMQEAFGSGATVSLAMVEGSQLKPSYPYTDLGSLDSFEQQGSVMSVEVVTESGSVYNFSPFTGRLID